ncbi:MAG: acetyl-CoA hydrolase/transferase C-terminal domain-containing protein, partial [Actinomycetota bacterium]|nr:acetyl-CoA hydrolase/transferase C-terminal domain-containing protein [Actinomycetota bacterium]
MMGDAYLKLFDAGALDNNNKLISTNTTLEIDITGQCASESFGPIQYTATGGQVGFTRGAWISKGGKSLMLTSSTTKDKDSGETVSKIVPRLRPGAVVTLTRTDVIYVSHSAHLGDDFSELSRALISPGCRQKAARREGPRPASAGR